MVNIVAACMIIHFVKLKFSVNESRIMNVYYRYAPICLHVAKKTLYVEKDMQNLSNFPNGVMHSKNLMWQGPKL
jgi:hypothetical protein